MIIKSTICAPLNPLRIAIIICLVWIVCGAILAYRVQTLGAFTSVGSRKTLRYITQFAHAKPADSRLNQSYSRWALELNGTDASNYLKTGIGFADGHGISLKDISPDNPNSKTYIPYYYQAVGPPLIIGTMIKLFGEQEVLPYFILVLFVHLAIAFSAAFLASRFVSSERLIVTAGLLSLLCLPALSFNFGLGLFCGESFAGLFIGWALIALCLFWEKIDKKPFPYVQTIIPAVCFGFFLALAAYARDIYTTFAQFSFVALSIYALFNKEKIKPILLFVLISALVLSACEYPWEKRNQKLFNEFTMTGSTYCGYALWYFTWADYKESKRWAGNSSHGLGNYLAPEKSADVLAKLEKNKKTGSAYALQSLLEAIKEKPWQALSFKLHAYLTLWFGSFKRWYIFAYCLISALAFLLFAFVSRFRLSPSLWLFPLFLLCLSPLIHYEHRYSQPFFLFSTPIAIVCLLQQYRLYRLHLAANKNAKS